MLLCYQILFTMFNKDKIYKISPKNLSFFSLKSSEHICGDEIELILLLSFMNIIKDYIGKIG